MAKSVNQRKLILKAMSLLGDGDPVSQIELSRRINRLKIARFVTSQSTVSKWLRSKTHRIDFQYAICIDILTDGEVSVSDFYPEITKAVSLQAAA